MYQVWKKILFPSVNMVNILSLLFLRDLELFEAELCAPPKNKYQNNIPRLRISVEHNSTVLIVVGGVVIVRSSTLNYDR